MIVPARGGSKSIELKNIRPINGVPLVTLVGKIVQQLTFVDRAIVSTDHPEIARIAKESGLDVPFMRPPELSGDNIADWDVLVHALLEIERIDTKLYDIIVMLQPTSPMRKKEHIIKAINKLIQGKYDSVWTVSETDAKYHPLKQLKIVNEQLDYYDSRGNQIIARQQLEPLYHKNGVAYVMTRQCLLEQKTIKGTRCGALVIKDSIVDIDTLWDFKLAEFLLSESKNKD